MSSSFAAAYKDALKDLTTTEIAKIKLLRDLAKENPGQATKIVEALTSHAYTCPAPHRLPVLYLMDCILKSAGEPYPKLLASPLQQVFTFMWDSASPDLRTKLAKTAGTWKDFLPAEVMAVVMSKMQASIVLQPPAPQQQSLLFPSTGQVLGSLPASAQIVFNSAGQPVVVSALRGAAGTVPLQGFQQVSLHPHITQQSAYGGVLLPPANSQLPHAAAPSSILNMPPSQLQGVLAAASAAAAASSLARTLPPSQPGAGGSSGGASPKDAKSSVDALFAAIESSKAKFLDLQFARNRRLQAATHQVRHWYATVDKWLEGTREVQEVITPFAEQEASEAQAGGAVQVSQVEEDPSQPMCAISGEAFERTYDPDTDKWYYEDAVVLTGEQAAAYGVMEGSIVKVHCLAGAPPTATRLVEVQQQEPPSIKGKSSQDSAHTSAGGEGPGKQAGGSLKRAPNQPAAACASESQAEHQAPEAKRIKAV